jgi:hypothetical protein
VPSAIPHSPHLHTVTVWLLATLIKNDLWISLKPDEARETGAARA